MLHPSTVKSIIKVLGREMPKVGLKKNVGHVDFTLRPYSLLPSFAIHLPSLTFQFALQESPGLSLPSDWLN